MPPDLASASAKWKVPQNRLPKMPQDAFSVGVRYHPPSEILPRSQALSWRGIPPLRVTAKAIFQLLAGYDENSSTPEIRDHTLNDV
jgi:hypothetical protein